MRLNRLSDVRILIVEDDAEVRGIIEAMLTEAGMTVATAATAWIALDLLERNEFNLMVTDLNLPGGLDGKELVCYARSRHPSLKSLFISGIWGPVGDDPVRDEFIAKPFYERELLGCVWELLSREFPQEQVIITSAEASALAVVEAKIRSPRATVPFGMWPGIDGAAGECGGMDTAC